MASSTATGAPVAMPYVATAPPPLGAQLPAANQPQIGIATHPINVVLQPPPLRPPPNMGPPPPLPTGPPPQCTKSAPPTLATTNICPPALPSATTPPVHEPAGNQPASNVIRGNPAQSPPPNVVQGNVVQGIPWKRPPPPPPPGRTPAQERFDNWQASFTKTLTQMKWARACHNGEAGWLSWLWRHNGIVTSIFFADHSWQADDIADSIIAKDAAQSRSIGILLASPQIRPVRPVNDHVAAYSGQPAPIWV